MFVDFICVILRTQKMWRLNNKIEITTIEHLLTLRLQKSLSVSKIAWRLFETAWRLSEDCLKTWGLNQTNISVSRAPIGASFWATRATCCDTIFGIYLLFPSIFWRNFEKQEQRWLSLRRAIYICFPQSDVYNLGYILSSQNASDYRKLSWLNVAKDILFWDTVDFYIILMRNSRKKFYRSSNYFNS